MKRIISFAVCLMAAAALFAQPQGHKQNEEQRKKEFERIQTEKIAFITQELDLTPEEEALWDLGELNEADLKVLAPVETSSVGLNLSASAEIITFTADFGDEASAFFGDLSVYDFDPAADTAEFDDTVSE